MAKSSISNERIYGLDILRVIAISTVVIAHSSLLLPSEVSLYFYKYMPDGVSIFFVLSGFLIGAILLKKINTTNFNFADLFDFWVRRWLRTLPAFFVVIFFLLLFYWHSNQLPAKKIILECITFSQCLFFGRTDLYFESWSLAVEEWFYLLIPLLLYCCYKIFNTSRKQIFLIIIFCIIIIDTGLRLYRTSHINYTDIVTWDHGTRRPVFLRLDSIMFGMLGAYLNFYRFKIWVSYKNIFFFIGLLVFVCMTIVNLIGTFNFIYFLSLTLESIATLFLLPKLNSLKTGKGYIYQSITFVSIISYSLYLLNATPFYTIVFHYYKKYIPISLNSTWYYPVTFIFYYLSVIIGSFILYRLIEKPFMQLRNKLLVKEKQQRLLTEVFSVST